MKGSMLTLDLESKKSSKIRRSLRKLRLRTPHGNVQLLVGRGSLEQLPNALSSIQFSDIALVADKTVFTVFGDQVTSLLEKAGHPVQVIEISGGEINKNLQSAKNLYSRLVEISARRTTLVVALGGGVITDLVGFVASTYMRGLPLILIPTTLLAQADAAIGGKTGINLLEGKNLVGTFYHPQFAFIDSQFLKTLPAREFRNGFAEIIKMCMLEGEKAFREAFQFSSAKEKEKEEILDSLLLRSISGKLAIVERDPEERGERMLLNLGHTFAHAIETATHYERYTHGEAVAIGLVGACLLSEKVLRLSRKTTRLVEALLVKLGFSVRYEDILPETLLGLMGRDKKRTGSLRFVLLSDLGKAVVKENIPENLVMNVLTELRGEKGK